MTFDNPSPQHKAPTAAAHPNEAAAAHVHKVNWTKESEAAHGHGNSRKFQRHLADKGTPKDSHERLSGAESGAEPGAEETAAGGTDRLSEEASKRFAENAIKDSGEKLPFGGMKSAAKVAELHFSNPFEYLDAPDARASSGFPNKTEA